MCALMDTEMGYYISLKKQLFCVTNTDENISLKLSQNLFASLSFNDEYASIDIQKPLTRNIE